MIIMLRLCPGLRYRNDRSSRLQSFTFLTFIFLTFIFPTLAPSPVAAQQGVDPYPFDRVFTTPQERSALDALRRGEMSGLDDTARAVEVAPQSDQVRFSGYILRSDGTQDVWVDGRSQLYGKSESAARTQHGSLRSGEGVVEFRARDTQRVLKPGQVWLLNPDVVLESFEASGSTDTALDAGDGIAD